jgi:hypothetical protein
MLRYHKAVFTEAEHWQRLEALTEILNSLKWTYISHCLSNIKSRAVDLEGLLRYIKGLRLNPGQIFEYYLADNGEPIKICYRIKWLKDIDIILVVSDEKEIITIYLNTSEDLHYTLKKELYQEPRNN